MVPEKRTEGSGATDGGRQGKMPVRSAVVPAMLPHILFALSFVIFDLPFDRRLVGNGTMAVLVLAMTAALLLGYAGTLPWVLGASWVLVADDMPGHSAAGSRIRQPRGALLCASIVLGLVLSTTGCRGTTAEVEAEPVPTTFSAPQVAINDGGLRVTSEDAEWDGFGEVLDIRGDLALLGATDWNHYGDGYAYLYRHSGESWQLEAQLAASDRGPGAPAHPGSMGGQRFGSSVSLGDGILVVGAPGTDARAGAAVYVFEHDGQTWIETAKLSPEGAGEGQPSVDAGWLTGDRMPRRTFGALVALHGDTLAVGGDAATRSVAIFERDEEGWQQQATIGIPGMPDHDLYMVSMDFYGDTLALGALYVPPQAPLSEDSLNVMNMLLTGKPVVYLFERDGPRWRETLRFAPQGDGSQGDGSQEDLLFLREVNIGASVALEGDGAQATRLAVGLPGFPDLSAIEDLREAPFLVGAEPGDEPIPGFPPSPREVGAVTLFERKGDVWQQDAILTPATGNGPPEPGYAFATTPEEMFNPDNLAAMVFPGHLYSSAPEISFFGATVDLDGKRLGVTSGYANATHLFERSEDNWHYRLLISPSDGEMWEDYAQVVALSGDTLLLGTPGEFGNSAWFFDLPTENGS